MKPTIFSLYAALATLAVAQPHRHSHRHMAQHHKRDASPAVVWVTKPEVKMVDVTTTVWIAAAQAESTSMSVASAVVAPANPTEPSPIEAAPTDNPAHDDDDDEPTLPDVPVPDEPELDLPTPGDLEPQIPSTSDPETPPPAEPDLESPPTAPAPEPAPPAVPEPEVPSEPAPDAAAPPANQTNINNAPKFADGMAELASGGSCSASSPCSGDITYYDPGVGMGACGWQSTKNEPVVALPHQFMGPQSNGNPYCGKTVTIKHGGKTSTAKIVDKCMGCNGFSIDLSDAAFTQLSALSVGRTDATWWIN